MDHGISGAAVSRPALGRALAALQEGDVLVVWVAALLGVSPKTLWRALNGTEAAQGKK